MGDWMVVRHKRGRASRKLSAPQNAPLPAPLEHPGATAQHAFSRSRNPPPSYDKTHPPECLTPAGEGDEARLLANMRRVLATVEQSVFFARFLKQIRDLEVVENLMRGRGRGEEGDDGEQELEEEGPFESSNEGQRAKPFKSATVELVVYGVGSITNSEISRCQLSLALLLKQKFATLLGHVFVFDPVMSSSDRIVMLQLGVSPLEDNDEGRRPLSGPTLFYMPHCDVELYESVLQANLKPATVDQMVILGNSFRMYQHRWSVSPLPQGDRPSCLLKVQPTVQEIPLADDFSPNAFNDTGWHFFSQVDVLELH